MKLSLKAILPMLVVTLGTLGGLGMIAARPTVSTQPPTRRLPLVRVMTAETQSLELAVEAHGSVMPRTESTLVAEVSGRIIETSPSLASGGFVEPGDVLVHIDPSDYEIAVERGEAVVARTESQLQLARSSLERQRRLTRRSVSSSANLENALNGERVAEANQREAKAALAQARRDLERTRVLAPFAGRVREKHVDVGQASTWGVAARWRGSMPWTTRRCACRFPTATSPSWISPSTTATRAAKPPGRRSSCAPALAVATTAGGAASCAPRASSTRRPA